MELMTLVIVFWAVCGIASAYVGAQKGKDAVLWFIGGVALGPIALLMVGLAPSADQSPEKSTKATRACPFCAEEIKAAAVLCRFCGHSVEPILTPEPIDDSVDREARAINRQYNGDITPERIKEELLNRGFDVDKVEALFPDR